MKAAQTSAGKAHAQNVFLPVLFEGETALLRSSQQALRAYHLCNQLQNLRFQHFVANPVYCHILTANSPLCLLLPFTLLMTHAEEKRHQCNTIQTF